LESSNSLGLETTHLDSKLKDPLTGLIKRFGLGSNLGFDSGLATARASPVATVADPRCSYCWPRLTRVTYRTDPTGHAVAGRSICRRPPGSLTLSGSRAAQAEQGSGLRDLSFGSSPAMLTPTLAAASRRRRPPPALSLSLSLSRARGASGGVSGLGFLGIERRRRREEMEVRGFGKTEPNEEPAPLLFNSFFLFSF